jgi:hypothetical protein
MRWALTALTTAAGLGLLAGCGATGDFGRMRYTGVKDDTHAWLGPAAIGPAATRKTSGLTWQHQLTDEERRLRDLAYPLIEPPYDRNQWYSVLGDVGLLTPPWPYPDRSAYASRLFQTAYRSQTARYNQLIEDIRNDVVRIEPFYATANYVADMDIKREKALASYVTRPSEEEVLNTLQRINENRAIVRWVQGSLAERCASYRIALERLVIAAPAPASVEAERALTLLQQRIGGQRPIHVKA